MIFFDDQLSEDDIQYYAEIAAAGTAQDALDAFMSDFILAYSGRYSEYVRAQMAKATEMLTAKDISDISLSVSSATVAFKEAQKKIYADFINNVYGDVAMMELNVTNPMVIEAIKNNTIVTFNNLIDGALQGTNQDVLETIRNFQYDLIEGTNKITTAEKFLGIGPDELQVMKEEFENTLRQDHSEFYSMSEDGNFVRYSDGKLVNFDDYNEMATRTTTLNVQRDAVQAQEIMDEHRVSEYLLVDNRPLKVDKKGRTHPREICQEILQDKLFGVAMVAHDQEAADLLGIYTLDEAKEEGALGPNCRHGIQPLDDETYTHIDNILYFGEAEAV